MGVGLGLLISSQGGRVVGVGLIISSQGGRAGNTHGIRLHLKSISLITWV